MEKNRNGLYERTKGEYHQQPKKHSEDLYQLNQNMHFQNYDVDKKIEHVQGIPFAPSLLRMPTYLPPRQVLESIDKSYPIDAQSQQSLQQISSQCHKALRLDSLENNNETNVLQMDTQAKKDLRNKRRRNCMWNVKNLNQGRKNDLMPLVGRSIWPTSAGGPNTPAQKGQEIRTTLEFVQYLCNKALDKLQTLFHFFYLFRFFSPGTTGWTIKVIVAEKFSPRIAQKSPTKYQNLILIESEGSTVQTTLYGQNITAFQDELILEKTYLISNALVKVTSAEYKAKYGEVQWTISRRTRIRRVEENNSNMLISTYCFTNFEDLPKYMDSNIDISK
ncbi:replication protein A 70 kDa DNA-binding subunit B-like [Forsythia ovata]|uniref:Replication protein A 70 kDa DNA-binding subunit B-like n=1 Tax=Forsythia ovata TaxID=205694 RepID=A0ABD1US93_9LAMI